MGPKTNSGKQQGILKEDLDSISEAISSLDCKIDDKFEGIKELITNLASKEDLMKVKVSTRLLAYENDKLSQYTRRENVRINGLVIKPGEDLSTCIVDLLNHLSRMAEKANDGSIPSDDDLDTAMVNFSSSEISVCHPVNSRNSSKPQHIVRFVSRESVRKVFTVKKFLKQSKLYQGVFIQEDLSPLRMKLLNLVKKKPGVSGVHTRDGVIHCTYSNQHVTVSNPDDLFRLQIDVNFQELGLQHLA